MANTTLVGDGFFLGVAGTDTDVLAGHLGYAVDARDATNSSGFGPENLEGHTLGNGVLLDGLTEGATMSDPDSVAGFEAFTNYGGTSLGDYYGNQGDEEYIEGYDQGGPADRGNDDANIDTGEAFTFDGRSSDDGDPLNDSFMRLDQIMRFDVTVELEDGTPITGVVNILVARSGHQFMTFSDGTAEAINATGQPINSITLDSYYGYGGDGSAADLTETMLQANWSNEINVAIVKCFTRGAHIATERGHIAVEDLQVGDMVQTLDSGLQPVRFIYSRKMPAIGEHRPIVFEPHTIGNSKQWRVSQQHRIHTSSVPHVRQKDAQDYLINAIHLVNGSTIRIDNTVKEVEYFHIMFDRHELIWSDGVLSESWQPKLNMAKQHPELRRELESIFPEFFQKNIDRLPARRSIAPMELDGRRVFGVTGRIRAS